MQLQSFRQIVPIACLLLVVAGCGSAKRYVPVSGTVRLNGQPYKDAIITFQPLATASNSSPGRGSAAYTDESGRFVLKTDDGDQGAIPGKHRIRIMTKGAEMAAFDPEKGTPDGAPPPKQGKIDPIPRSWNIESDKEFEVPPAGTEQADFAINTKG